MRTGKTESGFAFKINEEAMDDMRFVEMLAEVETNGLVLPKLLNVMLGEEQKEALYDHLEKDGGRATIEKTLDIVGEIMELAGEETKNS